MSDERQLEEFVQEQASRFAYPRTPNLTASVQERLQAPTRHHARFTLARAAGALVLVFVILMATIPEARAAVRAALQVGVVGLVARGEGATPIGTGDAPSGLVGIEALAGETTLEAARRQAPFDIPLPAHPPDLGAPERVFYQDLLGPMVILVWLDGEGQGEVTMSLHILGEDVSLLKLEPLVLAETEVAGAPAVWTQGPYLLTLEGRGLQEVRLVDGRVLIWTRGSETYRLESELGLDEALQVAESID